MANYETWRSWFVERDGSAWVYAWIAIGMVAANPAAVARLRNLRSLVRVATGRQETVAARAQRKSLRLPDAMKAVMTR
jgi:hypothetical protein